MDAWITGRVFACPLLRRSDTLHWNLIEYVDAVRGHITNIRNDRRVDHPIILMAHSVLGGHLDAAQIPEQLQALRTLGIRALLAPRFAGELFHQCFEQGVLAQPFEFHDEVDCDDVLVVDPEVGDVRNASTDWAYIVAPVPRCWLRVWRQAQRASRSTGAPTRRVRTASRRPRP